jgi:hypothetical protein
VRRGVELVVLVLALAGVLAGTVVAAGTGGPPTATVSDGTGDSGSGPDISSLTATLNGDQLTFSVTLANRSVVNGDESVQLFVTTPTAQTALNIAEFGDGSPPTLSTWDGTTWKGYHEIPGSWSSSTFSTTIALDDLQNALAEPVRPGIWVSARSYIGATPGAQPVQVDQAPNSGYLPVSTEPATGAPPVTTTPIAPTPPTAPAPTSGSHAAKPGREPAWTQKIVRLPHARIEWTKLAFSRLAPGTRVSLRCTSGCKLTERPRVSRGKAVSKAFVRRPFRHGQAFRVVFTEPDGAGWWSQVTVVAKPGGQELSTKDGCFLSDGTSLPYGKC